MSDSDVIKLKVAVTRLQRLAIMQSSSIMKLSAAILGMESLDSKVREEVFKVFNGLQEHIDVLSELNDINDLGGNDGE
ncbi:TPA: hypothetical protein ACKP22_002473 [Pseudomonas putida]